LLILNFFDVDNYIQVYSYTDGVKYYYRDTGNTFKQATITGTTLADKQASFEENITTHGALYKADKKA
jgi:translation elongation factor P/translation initiation factor 5A